MAGSLPPFPCTSSSSGNQAQQKLYLRSYYNCAYRLILEMHGSNLSGQWVPRLSPESVVSTDFQQVDPSSRYC
jgi:hypothetical protein